MFDMVSSTFDSNFARSLSNHDRVCVLDGIREEQDDVSSEPGSDETIERPTKRLRPTYDCEICDTSYTEKRTLARHLKTPSHCKRANESLPSYPCDFCGRLYSRDDVRQRHEKEVHFDIKRSVKHNQSSNIQSVTFSNVGATLTNERPLSPDQATIASLPSLCSSGTSASCTSEELLPWEKDLLNFSEWGYDVSEVGLHKSQSPEEDMPLGEGRFNSYKEQTEMDATNDIDDRITTPADGGTESSHQWAGQEGNMMMDNRASTVSLATVGSTKPRPTSSSGVLRSMIIYRGASPRLRGLKIPINCILCQGTFGSSIAEVRAHLDDHAEAYKSDFSCKVCAVTFTQERDLKYHERAAAKGHCGFEFDHIEPCQGHHIPDVFSQMLTDNDQMRFSCRLQHWEQAQLKAYLDQVKSLCTNILPPEPDCWSMAALRSSLSLAKSVVSLEKPQSVPDTTDYQGRLEFRRSPALLRIKAAALSSIKFGSNKGNLALQASLGDILKVAMMIRDGFDVNAMYCMHNGQKQPPKLRTPLEAALTNGRLSVARLLVRYGARINQCSDLLFLRDFFRYDAAEVVELFALQQAHTAQRSEVIDLFTAVSYHNKFTAQILLQAGADINSRLGSFSVLDVADSGSDWNMMRFLARAGAKTTKALGPRQSTMAVSGDTTTPSELFISMMRNQRAE